MTAPMPIAAPHTYTEPSGRTWALDRAFLDFHADGWQWDGQPYSPAAGPVLCSGNHPDRTERLLALACCSGLFQVPLNTPQDLAHILDPQDTSFRSCGRRTAGAQ